MSEQTVNETDNVEPEASAAEVVAPEDDLDTLLSQFDEETKEVTPVTEPEVKAEISADDIKLISEFKEQKQAEELKKVYADVRGDLDPEFYDDDFVDAWLSSQVKKDQRVMNAYLNKGSNPEAFNKIVKNLNKQLAARESKKPDSVQTETNQAITSAVRSASTSTPQNKTLSEKDLNNMSDREFRKLEQEMLQG